MTTRKLQAKDSKDEAPLEFIPATPAVRQRRSTAEIRKLILSSARELFGQRGYGQTTTRAIAEHAGVLEHLIFRNFRSKAQLFEEAVFLPFKLMLEQFHHAIRTERKPGIRGTEERARNYLETLYDQLSADQPLWRALLLAVQADDEELKEVLRDPHSPLIVFLDRVSEYTAESVEESGWEVDAHIATRIVFGFVFANALFSDMLFSAGKRPSRRALIDEMTAFMMHGVSHRPPARTPSSSVAGRKKTAPVRRGN
ncbi:helix-turn-helix domain containing protein [Caballeronia sp. LZ003]|uniref:TetR/AcrR family transcriptional regulator n=2 Tax=unclassified Caballeronia TaxID=2646786 RepID=UPI002857BFED|nr:helix-turn-helix domain-containing protein [Caballeronia sp. LZ002]MDR5852615.1 helix-turn-helix domain containing protein [Caballeronia sp. LZ003]